jgi:hypothetical protein
MYVALIFIRSKGDVIQRKEATCLTMEDSVQGIGKKSQANATWRSRTTLAGHATKAHLTPALLGSKEAPGSPETSEVIRALFSPTPDLVTVCCHQGYST